MRAMVRVLALLLCLVASPARAADKLLAVLPLDTRLTAGKLDEAGRVSLEEMLRDTASNALAASGWVILTGETTLQLLRDNGIDPERCEEQACHMGAARELNASKFLSGSVQWVEGEFVASVRLIDTKDGRILASERVEGDSVKTLRRIFQEKADAYFGRSGLVSGRTTPGPVAPTGKTGVLKVATEPPGAVVRIDGEPAGATPLKKALEPGTYLVTLESPGLAGVSRSVEITAGKEHAVVEQLVRAEGWIEIAVEPPGARVSIDGEPAGAGRQGPFAAGTHVVSARATGFKGADQTVQLSHGASVPVKLVLQKIGPDPAPEPEPDDGEQAQGGIDDFSLPLPVDPRAARARGVEEDWRDAQRGRGGGRGKIRDAADRAKDASRKALGLDDHGTLAVWSPDGDALEVDGGPGMIGRGARVEVPLKERDVVFTVRFGQKVFQLVAKARGRSLNMITGLKGAGTVLVNGVEKGVPARFEVDRRSARIDYRRPGEQDVTLFVQYVR